MALKVYDSGFAVGQLGREAHGRVNLERYPLAAKSIENYIVTPVGTLRRRDGMVFLARAKFDNLPVRLERFAFSIDQTYILEMGDRYVRFYRYRNRIEVASVPVEVATPYLADELFDIQTTQSADVMFMTHANHPPARLVRISDTEWRYEALPLDPPPITELDFAPLINVTPSAFSGTVTLTTPAPYFLEGDVGRFFKSGTTEARIREVLPEGFPSPPYPASQCIIETISPFDSLATIPGGGGWTLSTTPGLDVRVSFSDDESIGSEVTLHLESDKLPLIIYANVPSQNNLVLSGDFASFLGWSDQSGEVQVEGTHTGGAQPELVDNTTNFQLAGAKLGHRVLNVTQANEGNVGVIRSILGTSNANSVIDLIPQLAPSATGNWAAGDQYEIRETGSITHDTTAQEVQIRGGLIGRGALGQTTGAIGENRRFLLEVEIRKQPVIVQVASNQPPKFGAAGDDVVPETTLELGTQRLIFKTKGGNAQYLQFSNTQDTDAIVQQVTLFPMYRTGWRGTDFGRFVRVGGGLVEIVAIQDDTRARGVIRSLLTAERNDDDDIVVRSGLWQVGDLAWTLSRGYPRAVAIHQQRLFFAGTDSQPTTLWGSRVGEPSQFSLGPDDGDGLELEVSANQLNSIRWLESLSDLLVGTLGGEHLIQGGEAGLTPGNRSQDPQTTFGSNGLRPIRHDNVLYMVSRGNEQVYELTSDGDTGLLAGRDLTRLESEIARSGIKQWTLQSWPFHVIWAVRNDGVLIGLTLDLAENVRAWHHHVTQGSFLSVASTRNDLDPDSRLEDMYYAVSRTVNGQAQVHIELAAVRANTEVLVQEYMTLDNTVRSGDASAPPALTQITGLADNLEGELVQIVERRNFVAPDGLTRQRFTVHPAQTVVGGVIDLPEPMALVDVGFNLVPKVELLRPNLDLRDGNIQFRLQHVQRVHVRTIDTVPFLRINGQDQDVRLPEDLMDTGYVPKDQDIQTRSLSGWDGDGFVVIEQVEPFPSHLLSVGLELQVEELE